MESLGFLGVRHALGWSYFTQFNQINVKLQKYLRNNAVDLSIMKTSALDEFNYDQLENFLEYEEFLGNSYYTTFVNEFVERVRSLTSVIHNQ